MQIVGNYIPKMVIKFAFCVVSLLWTSRYVLICHTLLTYFLCCNLFVMFCLTLSAISTNVLEICLPITSFYPFTNGQLHHEYTVTAVGPLLQRFSRMFSKFAWATLWYWFFMTFYPLLWTAAQRSVAVLANFANLLKTCVAFCHTWLPLFLNANYCDIFKCLFGDGAP